MTRRPTPETDEQRSSRFEKLDPIEKERREKLRRLPADFPSVKAIKDTANSGTLAEMDMVLKKAGVLPYVERRFKPRRGRESRLTTRSFLTNAFHLAGPRNDYQRTNLAAQINYLDPQDAIDYGIQPCDELLGPVTYNLLCKRGTLIEQGLADGWIDPDGTVCDGQWFINAIIQATVPEKVRWQVEATAVDTTDFPSWARQLLSKEKAKTVTEADIADLNKPRRPRPGRTPREVKRTTGLIGQERPDGTVILSKTPGAGSGYRSAASDHPEGPFFGNYVTVAVIAKSRRVTGSRHKAKFGPELPPYVIGMDISPAGSNAARIALNALDQADKLCPQITDIIVDRGISQIRKVFNREVHKSNRHVTMDYKATELTTAKPVMLGGRYPAFRHGGSFLHAATPPNKRAPAAGLTEEELQQFYIDRAPFELVPNQHFPDGSKQFVSPTHTGSLYIDPARQTPKPGQPLHPMPNDFQDHFKDVPPEIIFQPYINASVEELDDFQQPPYGTPAQEMSYGRRLQSENGIAQAKENNGLTNKTCRVFNDGARLIAALARVAWHNLALTRKREEQAQQKTRARRAANAARPKTYTPQRFRAPDAEPKSETTDPDAAASRDPPDQ